MCFFGKMSSFAVVEQILKEDCSRKRVTMFSSSSVVETLRTSVSFPYRERLIIICQIKELDLMLIIQRGISPASESFLVREREKNAGLWKENLWKDFYDSSLIIISHLWLQVDHIPGFLQQGHILNFVWLVWCHNMVRVGSSAKTGNSIDVSGRPLAKWIQISAR